MPPTDPIADFITRIRNAAAVGNQEVTMPHSKVNEALAVALAKEGFLESVETRGRGTEKVLVVMLQYFDGESAFEKVQRVSRPGRRVYRQAKNLKPIRSGFGIAVLSTPEGVMTDKDAREKNVGGEVLCEIW